MNVALNKSTSASGYIMPYSSSRAVDGSMMPTKRWLCKIPCWMMVDFGGDYWINRWVVKHMGEAGWATSYYSLSDYRLQGSMDGTNWFDLDIVSQNQSSVTDRTFPVAQARFARLYVTKGLNVNPNLSSVMELEVYSADVTSPYLSGLNISSGTLTPSFSKNTYNYTVSVKYNVDSITLTPIAEDPRATIKVNGDVVVSGESSEPINLNFGDNAITVEVDSFIGGIKQNYTVVITKEDAPLYLERVELYYTGVRYSYKDAIVMNHDTTNYTAVVDDKANAVALTPYTEEASCTITIISNGNSQTVSSGETSAAILLNGGDNQISLQVAIDGVAQRKDYKITITK